MKTRKLAAKSPTESLVVMTQMILPSDANPVNAAFGGRVMEWIDICGAVCAQRHCRQVVVTASMDDLHFHAPIQVGWIVTLRARVLAAFQTSMEVGVTVTAENPITGEKDLTTSALLTFVALGPDRRTRPVPRLTLETPADDAASKEAHERRQQRLNRRNVGQKWLAVMAES
jgi:acyl-CoA hydrolase